MNKVFNNFISSKDNFPKEECTILNTNEDGIWESPNLYWCITLEEDFNTFRMMQLRPYIWKGENETRFGWGSDDGMFICDNISFPIAIDSEYVIGYLPVDAIDSECINFLKETRKNNLK